MEQSLDNALKKWFQDGFGERPGFRDPELSWVEQMQVAFQPRNIAASVFAGAVTGILSAVTAIGYAALIFSAGLSQFEQQGIGYLLFGGMIVALFTALFSSQHGILAGIHDTGVAVVTLAGVTLVAELPANTPPEVLLYTITATIMLASISAGVFFFVLGQVKLGNLIRYIPFPVIGGFLSGSGILVLRGSFTVMSGVPFGLELLSTEAFIRWLPGLVFTLIAFFVVRRIKNFLAMPALIAGSIIVFYIVAIIMGESVFALNEGGWLLGITTDAGLWQPITPADLQFVDWGYISTHLGSILTVGVAVLISMLVQASGIEVVLERDFDLNHELKLMGIVNIFNGLVGSTPGAHYVASTTLADGMNASTRLVGVVQAAILAVVLFVGGSLLFYMPRFVVGGILMYVGVLFLHRWVLVARKELPIGEYVIILLILGTIYFYGFLPGVGLGLASSVVLFVVNYSRVDVIRESYNGLEQQSTVERPLLHREVLKGKGHWLYMLKLQGFIFFGTSNRVFREFRKQVENEKKPQPHYFFLDFTEVSGVDSSAMQSFHKIIKMARQHDIKLILTAVSDLMLSRLHDEPFAATEGSVWIAKPDLDAGLEWYEEQLLAQFNELIELDHPETMAEHLQHLYENQSDIDTLMSYFEVIQVQPGEDILWPGKKAASIDFIEQGRVEVLLQINDEDTMRLRTLIPGTIIGEIGIYLDRTATATCRAVEPTTLFRMSKEKLAQLEHEQPHMAIEFHRFMAEVMALRLLNAKAALKLKA